MKPPPDYRKTYNPPPLIDQDDLFTGFDDVPPPPPPPPRLPPIPVAPTGQRAQTAQDVAIDLADNDIYGKWLAFHLNNPHVYKQLRTLSLDASRNRQVFGIGAIVEIARWERRFTTQGEDYKMPNAFRSMYEPPADGAGARPGRVL